MPFPIVNSVEDVDAIRGTERYVLFLKMLEGSLWRIVRDDTSEQFVVVEDNSTIERYGFAREDFPDAKPPALPEWSPLPKPDKTVSPFQAKAALLQRGLLGDVEALVMQPGVDPFIQLAWTTALEFRRYSPAVLGIAEALNWTEQQLDELFALAATLEI